MTATVNSAPLNDEMMRKVQNCLAILETAQHLCNSAARELSPVPGFADQWSQLSTPYDAVKHSWHLVNDRLNRMRVRAERGQCPGCGDKHPNAYTQCPKCLFSKSGDPS